MVENVSSPQPKGRGMKVKAAICHIRTGHLVFAVLACLSLSDAPAARAEASSSIEQTFAGSLTALPAENVTATGSFYVPVYSSVSMSHGKVRADFSVTLSIHNASETRPRVLRHIAYFETSGKMVESYLTAPVALKPFSTVEVFVPTTDIRGGTGANFVVDWAATGDIAEPVVEALMVGGIGNGHYAFTTQGRPLKVIGKN
jgi:hypothetical protein